MTWKLFQLYRRYAGRRYGSHFARYAAIMRRYLGESNGDLFNAVRLLNRGISCQTTT